MDVDLRRSVDFNEDFSAFHAATLREQALFLSKATTRVLSEYKHLPIDDRPRKATLLAHSMGGIVARLALTLGENDLIDVILTMSTPHLFPPSTLEYEMEVIYESISRAYNESSPLLFSICGGVSDSQIVSDACALSRDLISEKDGFAVFSSGIPGVWTGVDHQAMVWCHQVRWRVAKILLEMTGVTGRRDKLAVAEKWLLHRTRSLSPPSDLNRILEIQVKSENMTILLWPSGSGTLQEDPPIRLQWCDVDGSCRDVNGKVQPFPRPSDEMAPFPLVGEGIKQNEVAFAVSTELPAPRGSLVVYGQELESSGGPHLMESVRGNSWCE